MTSINNHMIFEVVTEPFEHIIIHDVFSPEELKNVWAEIEFLHPRLLRVGDNGFDGGSAKDDNGGLLKKNRALGLHDIYNFQTNVSYILEYLVKLFHDADLENIALHEAGYYYRLYTKARTYYFHLQYY